MKWHLAQLGSREKYLYPRIINNKKRIKSFSTDIWLKNINSFSFPLPGSYARLRSRWHPDLKAVDVKSRNLQSLYRILNPYPEKLFNLWVKQGKDFGEWASKNMQKVGIASDDYLFGYACTSLEIAKLAKEKNVKMVLGQYDPGLYWYKIQKEEAEKWINSDLDIYLPTEEFENRILMEWELSDLIIVNSLHSKEALKTYGVQDNKIKILPLIAPNIMEYNFLFNKSINKKIQILFVGNISFAKGFPYFAEAKKILENDDRFEFYAIGDVFIPKNIIEKNRWDMNFTGRLNQEELVKFYKSSHVLVFPTISEGFGQVQLEAMAYGLPVIATEKCGNVVINNVNGKLINTCDSDHIVESILDLVSDRDIYFSACQEAINTAKNFSFSNVEKRFWEIFE